MLQKAARAPTNSPDRVHASIAKLFTGAFHPERTRGAARERLACARSVAGVP